MADWNQNNALNRLKQRLTDYFTRADSNVGGIMANQTLLRKYVWMLRSVLLEPTHCADIFGFILNYASRYAVSDYQMECMFRYYFANMLFILSHGNYFTLNRPMAKRALFNSSSAYTLGNIRAELTTLNFRNVEAMPAEAETTAVQDVYVRNAVPSFLALNAQEYRSGVREHVLGQLANMKNLPPNIPSHIQSFGLENPVDFVQRRINPGYVARFIDYIFGDQ